MAMPVGLYTVTLETIEFNKSRYCADNKFVFMYQEEEKAKIIKKKIWKVRAALRNHLPESVTAKSLTHYSDKTEKILATTTTTTTAKKKTRLIQNNNKDFFFPFPLSILFFYFFFFLHSPSN